MKQQDLTGMLARWVYKLQSFKFTVSHRKGKENLVPDALSRIVYGDFAGVELSEAEIGLNSIHFEDPDYRVLLLFLQNATLRGILI